MSAMPASDQISPPQQNDASCQKPTLESSFASQGGAKAYLATSHPQPMQLIVRWGIRMVHPGFDALFLQFPIFRRSVEVETHKHRQRQDYTRNGASHEPRPSFRDFFPADERLHKPAHMNFPSHQTLNFE